MNRTSNKLIAFIIGTITLKSRINPATKLLLFLCKVLMVPMMLCLVLCKSTLPSIGKSTPILIERMGFTKPGYRQISEAMMRSRAMIFLIDIEKRKAENEGFEPPIPFWGIHAFQACALSHSANSPKVAAN